MITIVLPVSRTTFLKPVMESLNNLNVEANLLVYVDGDLNDFERWRNAVTQSKFNQKLCVYRKRGKPDDSNILKRRERIGEIHREMLSMIKESEYIFLTEDDTTFPNNTVNVLMKNLNDLDAGFVSGVQIGRWGFPYIGAWKVDNLENPTFVESVRLGEGILEVDTAGFYACLMRKETYLNGSFEPFEDVLGPDFSFGLSLRQKGLKNYINFDIKCGHLRPDRELTFENTKTSVVRFVKGEQWSIKF